MFETTQPTSSLTPLPPTPAEKELERFLANALLLVDNGDFKNAENLLDYLFARYPKNPKILHWLGYVHKEQKQFKQALFFYQNLAELFPSEESFYNLAKTCYDLEELFLARVFYQKSISYATFDSAYLFESYKNLGNIALKGGDIESAEENYNKAYTLMPHSDVLLVNYGTLGLQKGDLNLAQERFQEALSLNQNNDRAWIGLSFVQRKKGDRDLAWATVQRGMDVNPENYVGLHACIEWGIEDKKVSIALFHVRRFLKFNTRNQEISYCEAGLLFQLGHFQESLESLNRHLKLFSSHREALELKGLIQNRLSV